MATLPYHLITAQEFAALPHEGMRLELVKGEIVAMAPGSMSFLTLSLKLLHQEIVRAILLRKCKYG